VTRLDGKVAIVTGAGGAIGSTTARVLAAAGAAVVAADKRVPAAEKTATAIRDAGGRAIAHGADIAEEADWQVLVARTTATFGGLDILVNNAAAASREDADIVSMEVAVWDAAMRVNARGPMLGCKHAIPELRRRGGGAIVNIVSGSALTGQLNQMAYSAAKAATIALTRNVATLHGKEGIRCNAIAPGLILHAALAAVFPPEQIAIDRDNLLVPRSGTPEDIAGAVLFLASESAAFINAQVLCVDGGLLAHTPGYAQARALGRHVDYLGRGKG